MGARTARRGPGFNAGDMLGAGVVGRGTDSLRQYVRVKAEPG